MYGGKRLDRKDFRWNPATVQKHRFLSPFPASFSSIPLLGNNNSIRLSFPERFPKADRTTSYGVKIRIVSRRIRSGFGIQIPLFLTHQGTDRIPSYPERFRNPILFFPEAHIRIVSYGSENPQMITKITLAIPIRWTISESSHITSIAYKLVFYW
jgi:hypothetical protein